MKKRYLSMLLAVVMCLSFGITGAMAAAEEPVAEPLAEEAAEVIEVPAEPVAVEAEAEAPAEEIEAAAADVPTPVSVQAGAVALDGADVWDLYVEGGVAIAGYGGTVVYNPISSADPNKCTFEWSSPSPTGVDEDIIEVDPDNRSYKPKLTVGSDTTAGEYSFLFYSTYGGTLKVYSLEDAIAAEKVSSSGFTLELTGYLGALVTPDPLSGAQFGLYTSDPSKDESAEPVATFTTNEYGNATISASAISDADALPALKANGGTTYYLKQLTTSEGWDISAAVTEVWGYAEWTYGSNGETTKLTFTLVCPNEQSSEYFYVENTLHEHEGGTATCTEKAVCTVCGEAYGELDSSNHAGGTEVKNAKAATCTEDGYTGDTYCKGCGEKVSAGEPIDSLGHIDENNDHLCDRDGCGVTVSEHTGGTATCTEKAVCTVCCKAYGELDSSNHAGGTEVKNAKAATCTEDGYTGDTYCKGCGEKVSAGEPIDSLGHIDENNDHLCDRDGCGVTVSEHTGGTATCTSKAVCTVCGEAYGDVDSSNHALTHVEAKAATTGAEGNIEYWHCADCDTYFADEAGEKEITKADTVIEKLKPEQDKTDKKDEKHSPKTGDSATPILWIAIVVIAVAAVVVLLIVRKKKTK